MKRREIVDELSVILVKNKAISLKDLVPLAESFKNRDDIAFEDFLLEEGVVEKSDLLKALSEYYQLPAVDVVGEFFDHQFLRLIPKDIMLRNFFIPHWRDADLLAIVAAEPNDPDLPALVGKYVTHNLTFEVGLAQDIRDTIREFYDEPDAYQPNEISNQLMERSAIDVHPMGEELVTEEKEDHIPVTDEETIDDYESK